MQKKIKLILGIIILGSNCLVAQQTEVYNQFFMNPYLYNAAYAGVEGHTVLYALYNKKWTNISGSPQIAHFSFHTPLKGGIGIGAAVFNDTDGIISKNLGKVSGSYLITIDREHHLRFGLSVGGGTQGLDYGLLDDPTDPAFLDMGTNTSFMVADFGATYHFGHFNVGFSLPNLISYDQFHGESLAPVRVTPLDNAMFKINYRGHLSHDIAIEPHLIYRYSNIVPDQYEATVILHIYHLIWAGATYRQNNTYAATIGAKIKEKFAVGYGFELGNANISGLTGPSHEVHIGMHLGTKKDHAAHVSSFIKSHRLTPEQRAALAAKEREEKLQELQSSREQPQQNSDALGIAGTQQKDSDALGIAGSKTPPEEKPTPEVKEDPWKVDETRQNAVRTNPFGEQEKAIVIKHQNEQGETVYAVAWEPIDEDWEMIDNEAPIKRSSSDGTSEIGVKYYRTNERGQKEMIIKWEPVVTEEQVNDLLRSGSTAEALAQNVVEEALTEEPITTEPTERDVTINTEEIEETPSNVNETVNLPIEEEIQQEAPQELQTEVIQEETKTDEVIAQTPPTPAVEDERQKGDESLTEDFRPHEELADSDQHLEVKRGDNMLELPVGYYLIGGAFEEYEHAEAYSDELFPKGYHDVIVGYLSARGYYYTVLSRHNTLAQANAEKARIRKRPGMSEVWVLQVQD